MSSPCLCRALFLLLCLACPTLQQQQTSLPSLWDLPLKQCPGLKVSLPSWMIQQNGYYGFADDSFTGIPDPPDFDSDSPRLASMEAPYFYDGSGLTAGISKTKLATRYFSGVVHLQDLRVSVTKLHCMAPAASYKLFGQYDNITSATYLGSRYIVITTNASSTGGGSNVGRVILLDYHRLQDNIVCDGDPPRSLLPENLHTKARQIHPAVVVQDTNPFYKEGEDVQIAFHGCHADPYSDESLAGIKYDSPSQPFYMVCMSSDAANRWWLRAFRITLHINGNSLYDDLIDASTCNVTNWISNPLNIGRISPASTVHTFPVHVIGKNLVLYRCNATTAQGHQVHWCWRKFYYVGFCPP